MTNRGYNKVARAVGEEETRQGLLEAAGRAFFAGPWDKASLEAIASDAGVTKQTLLRHFGSKPRLLEEAYSQAFEAVRAQRMRAPTDDPAGAVANLLDHYYDVGDRALALAAAAGGVEIERMGRAGRKFHYDWVEHAFGAWLAAMGKAEARRSRAALIAVCDVHTWALLARDLDLPRREVEATLLQMINPLLGEKK